MKVVLGRIITPRGEFRRLVVEGRRVLSVDNAPDVPEGAEVIELG